MKLHWGLAFQSLLCVLSCLSVCVCGCVSLSPSSWAGQCWTRTYMTRCPSWRTARTSSRTWSCITSSAGRTRSRTSWWVCIYWYIYIIYFIYQMDDMVFTVMQGDMYWLAISCGVLVMLEHVISVHTTARGGHVVLLCLSAVKLWLRAFRIWRTGEAACDEPCSFSF